MKHLSYIDKYESISTPPIAGQTWFSSHGPNPVFTDSQQNGSRVLSRLGDEVNKFTCPVFQINKFTCPVFQIKIFIF